MSIFQALHSQRITLCPAFPHCERGHDDAFYKLLPPPPGINIFPESDETTTELGRDPAVLVVPALVPFFGHTFKACVVSFSLPPLLRPGIARMRESMVI